MEQLKGEMECTTEGRKGVYDYRPFLEDGKSFPFAMLPPEDDDEFIIDSQEKFGVVEHKNIIPTGEAVLNLLASVLGSGLLVLPYVVSKGGLIAIGSLLVVPVICYYTGKILIDCLYEKTYNGYSVRVRSTYRDIGEACWPGKLGVVTTAIQIAQLSLAASSCIVLSASLLSHILDFLEMSDRQWILIAALLAFPTILVRSLSQVSWLNIVSVTALFSPVVVITGYGFVSSQPWNLKDLPIWNLEGVPLSISIITHSYVTHGTLPLVEEGMKDKSMFCTMLKVMYLLCAILRTLFAVNGFFSYYGNINVIISNSLPPGVLTTVNTLLLIYSLLCYPFMGIALIHTVEISFLSEWQGSWYVISRILLTATTLFIGLLIPRYAVLIAISGNLKSVLGFILPCLFHLRLRASELSLFSIIIDFLILALGIAIVVIGVVNSTFQMIGIY